MRRLPTSINTNTYRFRKVAVTTTKKSQATMTLAWLWMKVSQRCLRSGVRAGPPSRRSFSTVRGETRIPSFSFSSLAMRSSPQVAFSAAISRIRRRRSLGRRGRPMGLDFQRQNSRNPWRCQRMSVDALTFTSASRHGNMRLRVAIIQRVESLARRGLTWRSWKSASCLRRKRFSAAKARRECAARKARRSRSTTTEETVRKQCATVRISGKPSMNLRMTRYRTLRDRGFESEGLSAEQSGQDLWKADRIERSTYMLVMLMERKVVEERAPAKPAACLPSALGNLELPAAARKSNLPLSRFPLQGKAGAGGFPPRRWHAVRQQTALAPIASAAPPPSGGSKHCAETPLAHPPDGTHRGHVQMVSLDLRDRSGEKLMMAAKSALTFTTFS